jgi:hypothetical protein
MDAPLSTEINTEINQDSLERLGLDHRLQVGASWFFWIAALTFISSLVTIIGNQAFGFIIGLGVTQLIDTFALGTSALGIDMMLVGLFLFLGFKARKAEKSAFILGIFLYALDSLVFIALQDYVGLIFHAFVLLGLLGGIQAINQMQHVGHTESAYQ